MRPTALSSLLIHVAAAVVVAMMLLAAAQPLIAEDTWWHLAMGAVYAEQGPWLEGDPLLFTAAGPPAPAAWGSDILFHAVERSTGFTGLRVLHAMLVAAILALVWSNLRRLSGSPAFASAGTSVFVALSAYRLFQLRPHLFTILALLWLVRLVWIRVDARIPLAAVALLFALWANLHGAFLIGLGLLFASAIGATLLAFFAPQGRSNWRRHARALGAACGVATLASLLNPIGARAHLLPFIAGEDSPALSVVGDEWAPLALLSAPNPGSGVDALAWALVWSLILATLWTLWRVASALRRPPESALSAFPGPLWVVLAGAALLAMLTASRLVWLGVLPLGAWACTWPRSTPSAWRERSLALASLALVPAFAWFGAWPGISATLEPARFAAPYSAEKFNAQPIWFLDDAGLQGRLWNDYRAGNFAGYWLTPCIEGFINGSLNVSPDTLRDAGAVRARSGKVTGESFHEILARHRIDLFLGSGLPQVPAPEHPVFSTTAHLEGVPGWLLAFRNLRSAVYLRTNDANRANRARLAAYYAARGVPFDPERGLDVQAAIVRAPNWSIRHGLIPPDHAALLAALDAGSAADRAAARERLAGLYALLGLYSRAAELDATADGAETVPRLRRRVWSLLRAGHWEEAHAAGRVLASRAAPGDGLSRQIALRAREAARLAPAFREAQIARLPFLPTGQGGTWLDGILEAEARPRRSALQTRRESCRPGNEDA